MRSWIRRHPVVAFVALAYAFTWSTWIPMAVLQTRVGLDRTATHFPGLLGPMLSAAIVSGLADGRELFINSRSSMTPPAGLR